MAIPTRLRAMGMIVLKPPWFVVSHMFLNENKALETWKAPAYGEKVEEGFF